MTVKLVPLVVEVVSNAEGTLVTIGETEVVTVTVPVNPRLFTMMADVPELPARKLRVVGLPEIVKSAVTVTLTINE